MAGPFGSNNRPLFPDIFFGGENGFVRARNCFAASIERPRKNDSKRTGDFLGQLRTDKGALSARMSYSLKRYRRRRQRDAIRRCHLASIRALMARTRVSWATQKARLAAGVPCLYCA
jgi:hypothetical protein